MRTSGGHFGLGFRRLGGMSGLTVGYVICPAKSKWQVLRGIATVVSDSSGAFCQISFYGCMSNKF
jgi:hypothetical protein